MKSERKSVGNDESEWNPDTIYALGLFKNVSEVFGFWPTKNRTSTGIRVGIISFFQLSLIVVFIRESIIYGNCGTIVELVDTITFIVCCSLAILKIVQSWLQKGKIRKIVESAIEDWSTVIDEQTRELMIKYAQVGRITLICLVCGSLLAIAPLIGLGLPGILKTVFNGIENNSHSRTIPVTPRCWIPHTTSFHLYVSYYIFVSFHLIFLAAIYTCVDAFVFGTAMHVCGQFEIFCNSMENVYGVENFHQQRAIIKKFSKRHDHLLKITNLFEDAFNLMTLFEVVANTFLICISGIVLLLGLKTNDGGLIFSMTLRILVLFSQLFMYSYVGENLSTRTEKIQTIIYNCPWFNMRSRTVKDMQFIMMRSNKTFHLTAGKIYCMNLSNFKDLCKSIFSMFSLLRLMFGNQVSSTP